MKGEGGFRMGVDLSGGTILVYEVDQSKMTEQTRATFKPEDLAAALKRRIDPADLFNVTIRPVPGDPPRVEIILPTGGRVESNAGQAAWQGVIDQVKDEYSKDWPIERQRPEGPFDDVVRGAIQGPSPHGTRTDLKKNGTGNRRRRKSPSSSTAWRSRAPSGAPSPAKKSRTSRT